MYFILFISMLIWSVVNVLRLAEYYLVAESTNSAFMLLFLLTFVSFSGTTLFGYAWKNHNK